MRTQSPKGSHLTLDDREFIEDALNMRLPLKEIAEHRSKDATTISKEIKHNRILSTRNPEEAPKTCQEKGKCKRQHVCGNKTCEKYCRRCKHYNCYNHCKDFKSKSCSHLERFPHVCNGCPQKVTCRLVKYKYRAKDAHQAYKNRLTSSRIGVDLSSKELKSLDSLITPLVQKGQSLKHIHANHRLEIKCSLRSLYNYFDMNLFTARNIDLPRKVKFKPRKRKMQVAIRSTSYNEGRKYEDYLNYVAENPTKQVVQMDTVYNQKSGPAILTLYFVGTGLMIGYHLERLTSECVTGAIDSIHQKLGDELFKRYFQVLLTDNGSEFKASDRLEKGPGDTKRTQVFYCEPYASYQKGQLENNHGFIRMVIPKKRSMATLTQDKVSLMMNHINSVTREGLSDKTAYAIAEAKLGNELLTKLGLELIHHDEVLLKPALLK